MILLNEVARIFAHPPAANSQLVRSVSGICAGAVKLAIDILGFQVYCAAHLASLSNLPAGLTSSLVSLAYPSKDEVVRPPFAMTFSLRETMISVPCGGVSGSEGKLKRTPGCVSKLKTSAATGK